LIKTAGPAANDSTLRIVPFSVANPAAGFDTELTKLVQLVVEALCCNKWAYINFSNGKY